MSPLSLHPLSFISRSSIAMANAMTSVFPEALMTLEEADPVVFGIVEDEKKRQW